jgi:cation transport regulator ChaC
MKPRRPERVDLWVFGYGSLVWRPAFPFLERRAGFIEGWSRRFWQGSTDHRGVPEAPGRVVTLVREARAICWGMAYRVAPTDRSDVLERLDHRESGGFERAEVAVSLHGSGDETRRALVYVAGEGNPNYLGPAPLESIAAQVRACVGPSGTNQEYLLRLAESLRDIGAEDDHVFDLARLVVDGTC